MFWNGWRHLIFALFVLSAVTAFGQGQPTGQQSTGTEQGVGANEQRTGDVAPGREAEQAEIPEITSVGQTALRPFLKRQIKARGIISVFIGRQEVYRFTMDDGSAIQVVGDFPEMGGTSWYLTARVVDGPNNTIQLSEVNKTPVTGGGGVNVGGFKVEGNNMILLAAGGILILAAIIALVAYVSNNKKAQQAEQEAIRAAERAEADNRQRILEEQLKQAMNPRQPTAVAAPVREGTVVSRGLVTVLSGPHQGQTFPLLDHRTSIGRDNGCAIKLEKDTAASGKHADIIITPDQRMYFDDQSRNGSLVDGEMISMTKVQKNGTFEVVIGGSKLRIEPYFGSPAESGPSSPASPSTAARPDQIVAPSSDSQQSGRKSPTMMFEESEVSGSKSTFVGFAAEFESIGGKTKGKVFSLRGQEITLGRENRDIILVDDTVSRSHATVKLRDDSFWIFDDGSMHGTFVNDEKVAQGGKQLQNGDLVRLGKTNEILIFRSLGA